MKGGSVATGAHRQCAPATRSGLITWLLQLHRWTAAMFRLGRLTTLVFALALLCTRASADEFKAVAATDKGWRPRAGHLTLGVALQIAETEVSSRKLSVADFQSPWFRYDYELYHPDNGDGDYVWVFVYEGKVPAPSNHFVVIVNDRTRYVEFVPGH